MLSILLLYGFLSLRVTTNGPYHSKIGSITPDSGKEKYRVDLVIFILNFMLAFC